MTEHDGRVLGECYPPARYDVNLYYRALLAEWHRITLIVLETCVCFILVVDDNLSRSQFSRDSSWALLALTEANIHMCLYIDIHVYWYSLYANTDFTHGLYRGQWSGTAMPRARCGSIASDALNSQTHANADTHLRLPASNWIFLIDQISIIACARHAQSLFSSYGRRSSQFRALRRIDEDVVMLQHQPIGDRQKTVGHRR